MEWNLPSAWSYPNTISALWPLWSGVLMDWITQPRERISTLTAPERRLHLSAVPRSSLHTSVILKEAFTAPPLNSKLQHGSTNDYTHVTCELINYKKYRPQCQNPFPSVRYFERVNRVCWCYTATFWIGAVLRIYTCGNDWPLVVLLLLYALLNIEVKIHSTNKLLIFNQIYHIAHGQKQY